MNWNDRINDEMVEDLNRDAQKYDYNFLLDYIDPDSDYNTWLYVGMGLKDAWRRGANVDVQTYDAWSRTGSAGLYREREPFKKWDSFKGEGITFKTVVHYAEEGGCNIKEAMINNVSYRPPREVAVKRTGEEPRENKKSANSISDEAKKEILDALNGVEFKEIFLKSMKNINNQSLYDSTIKPRGISKEVAAEYSVFPVTDFEINGRRYEKGVACFGSKSSYIFRNGDISANGKDDRKFRKPKGEKDIPLGLKRVIAEKDKTIPGGFYAPVFVCEGVFDAPSFSEVGDYDSIALIGTGNIDPVIVAYQEYEIKRPLILTLDNDKSGKEAQANAKEKLENAGVPFYEYQVVPDNLVNPETGKAIKDPNELLLFDKQLFEERIEQAVYNAINDKNTLPVGLQLNEYAKQIMENVRFSTISTGFKSLDDPEILDGGFYPGLYVLGAISSLGKTTLMLQIAENVARSKHDVFYFSLEMSRDELISKSVSRYTAQIAEKKGLKSSLAKTSRGVFDGRRYKNYSPEELELIQESIDAYNEDVGGNLYIVEGVGDVSVATIRAELEKHIKRVKETTGSEPDKLPMVFVDYLQIMARPDNGRAYTDKQIVDYNILELKRLSRDLNIPVFVISSLNRENYTKSINMTAFKESGAVEYSSDVLLGLEREASQEEKKEYEKIVQKEYETNQKFLRLKILKNRNGKQNGAVLFNFYTLFNLFEDDGIEQTKIPTKKAKGKNK